MTNGLKSVRGVTPRRSPGWLGRLRAGLDARIPCGYQDETGFHRVPEPHFGPPDQLAEHHPELIGGLCLSHLDFAEQLGRRGLRLAGFLIHHQNLFRSVRSGLLVEKLD